MLGSRGLFGGAGQTYQDQINGKLVFLSGSTKIAAYYNLADRKEADYTDLSLARYNQSGRDWDQFSNWDVAKQFATSATPDEAYFQSAEGARRDNLAYVAAEFGLNDKTRLTITPYVHTNRGAGDWHAPSYGASFSPDPIYFRQTQYKSHREGVNARLSSEIMGNQLEAGLWYEDNARRFAVSGVSRTLRRRTSTSRTCCAVFDRTGDLNRRSDTCRTRITRRRQLTLTYGAKVLTWAPTSRTTARRFRTPPFA